MRKGFRLFQQCYAAHIFCNNKNLDNQKNKQSQVNCKRVRPTVAIIGNINDNLKKMKTKLRNFVVEYYVRRDPYKNMNNFNPPCIILWNIVQPFLRQLHIFTFIKSAIQKASWNENVCQLEQFRRTDTYEIYNGLNCRERRRLDQKCI